MAVITRGLSELFEEFLRGFEDRDGERKYQVMLAQLAASGRKSIMIDYEDLIHYNTDLAESLLKDPDKALKEYKIAAFEVLSTENPSYAGEVKKSLTVRLRGVTDRIALRKVDTSHLDKMIAFAGMVIRTSELRPLLVDAAFVCPDGHTTMVVQEGPSIKRPAKCESCDQTRSFELDQKDSSFIDSQILRVQELPEELPPGQLPRFFDVDVEGDIVNTARPGDRAVMTGIVRAEPDFAFGQPHSRSFRSKIEANSIEVVGKEPSQVHISKEDEAIIRSIAASPDAYQKLIRSMAPGILGHEAVKEAILLLLVGGPVTVLPDGTKLRGDINVFLVGDPGVAKSEMLKFAAQVAPRGMFASGRGSTAAGLSAAVIREKNTLMLEAGVVVLADQGIACIDEFDKMKPEDRSALHEQMEQQTVTIAKGGIYATLNARTAILAATNPILGKYNPYQNLIDNITLPIPLLTRFDLIFVLRDTPVPAQDEKLATHILDVHRKRGYVDSPPIQFELLKKYLAHAKGYNPALTMEAQNRIKEYYLQLRRNASEGQIGATPRTLESLVRLASAKARLMLREQVTEEDALTAVLLMSKMVEDVLTDTETKTKGDFGILLGQPAGERGKLATVMDTLRALEGTDRKPIEAKVFRAELMKTNKFANEDEVDNIIRKITKEGIIFESKPGFYRRVQG
ncbi:MAG TPA: minichromosome maintenance protein MCM [Nitrososphaerales archaeon]|nr:minichromosome maintenance protein MCM [Nitrososphaerales archaeon]